MSVCPNIGVWGYLQNCQIFTEIRAMMKNQNILIRQGWASGGCRLLQKSNITSLTALEALTQALGSGSIELSQGKSTMWKTHMISPCTPSTSSAFSTSMLVLEGNHSILEYRRRPMETMVMAILASNYQDRP